MVVENFTGQSCNFARPARMATVSSPRWLAFAGLAGLARILLIE